MTYTVVAHVRRRQDITPSEFRAHYDTVHVPLLKSLVGTAFPLSHTRNYVARNPTTPDATLPTPDTEFAPVMYRGEASSVDYDSLTVMVWEDYAAFESFLEAFYRKEVSEKIDEDEKTFIDQSVRRIYALEQPATTTRD
ncbi:hypothetical protein Hte_011772 [Hypoxylon texense]